MPFNGRSLFRYLRYDIRLEQEELRENLGVDLDSSTLSSYRRMDVPKNIPALFKVAARAADKQMKRAHLASL